MELKINPLFRDLCPPLKTEERQQLHDNIAEDGVIESIKHWNGWIVDGHNRYEIASELNVEFSIEEFEFRDEGEVIDWIIRHQLGRRNLDPKQASYLRGKLYNETKGIRGNCTERAQNPGKSPKGHFVTSENAAEKVASETGVDPRTVKRDGKYAEAVDSLQPNVREAVRKGQVKVSQKDAERLSKQDKSTQAKVVKQVKDGEKKSVKEALDEVDEEPSQEKQVAANRRLVRDLLARSMRAVDDLHRIYPSRKRGQAIKLIQEVLELIW